MATTARRKHSKSRLLAKTAGSLTTEELGTLHHHARKAAADSGVGPYDTELSDLLEGMPDEMEGNPLLGDVRNPIP